jgi:hypothetical protein
MMVMSFMHSIDSEFPHWIVEFSLADKCLTSIAAFEPHNKGLNKETIFNHAMCRIRLMTMKSSSCVVNVNRIKLIFSAGAGSIMSDDRDDHTIEWQSETAVLGSISKTNCGHIVFLYIVCVKWQYQWRIYILVTWFSHTFFIIVLRSSEVPWMW